MLEGVQNFHFPLDSPQINVRNPRLRQFTEGFASNQFESVFKLVRTNVCCD